MLKFIKGFLILLITILLPVMVNAQQWLEDRDQKEGYGFKMGDSLILHLGLGVEGGYDTNALYTKVGLGAGRLRITPVIDIATRAGKRNAKNDGLVDATPPKVFFKFGLAGFWDHYFPTTENLNIDQLNKRSNPFGVNTHLNLVVFPEGKFSILTNLVYVRSLQPYETSADAQGKDHLRPGIGFRVRPGGGTLSIEVGYQLDFLYFEDKSLGTNSNHHSHDIRIITNWKVFPKTSLISKINFEPTIYYGDETVNSNSNPIRSLFGIQGLLSQRFGLMLLAGYGASFYKQGSNFDSLIAQAELMFFITPFSKLRIGGQRDFVDSFYSNYYIKTGGYLAFEQMFGGRLLATLKGDVFYRQYANFNYASNFSGGGSIYSEYTDRVDTWVTGSFMLEYRASDWLSFHTSATFMGDFTDFYINYTDDQGSSENIYSAFNKFEIFAGIRGHY